MESIDGLATLLVHLDQTANASYEASKCARAEASAIFGRFANHLPQNPLHDANGTSKAHPVPPSTLQSEENARLSLEVQALKEQLSEALDVAQTNYRAREQVEDWLFKALAEIDDLREDLKQANPNGDIRSSPPLTNPEPFVPPTHARRGSDLYQNSTENNDERQFPPATPSNGHATLSSLGRDLLRRTQKKMSPKPVNLSNQQSR